MKKILIVDDHAEIRLLLRMTLARDYEIIEANDGWSALELVRSQHPDMVLLDILMPGRINGLQVLHAIKFDPVINHTIVALVTSLGTYPDCQLGSQWGADAYFIKPFSPANIVSWLKDVFTYRNDLKNELPI